MTGIASMQSIADVGTPAQNSQAPTIPALAAQMPAASGVITVDHVIKATAEHFGTTPEDLISDRLTRPPSRQWQVAMYVAYEMTDRGSPSIAHHMGYRDHKAVLRGVRAIKGMIDDGDAEMVAAVRAIMERLPAPAGQPPVPRNRITVPHVIKATAEHFGTTPEVLASDRRTKSFVHYRHLAMYVAREMTGCSMLFIGRHMDRDHSTVLDGVRAITGLLDAGDVETVAAVNAIKERLSSPAGQVSVTPSRIKVRHVVKVTAAHFGTTPEALVSDRRTQPLVRHRQVAMYVAREMTGRSMPIIAYYMGNRDHTTVLHGARAVKGLLDAGDAETVAAVNAIKQRLQVLRTGRA